MAAEPASADDRAPAPRAATLPGQPPPVQPLPVQLLHDRVLVQTEADGERTSTGGILIPATAQVGRRLVWARVVGVGPNVRTVEPGDRVLFDPEDPREVELHGATYVMLRERDVHAVASQRVDDASTGLYL
jgi:chaperonin GroES